MPIFSIIVVLFHIFIPGSLLAPKSCRFFEPLYLFGRGFVLAVDKSAIPSAHTCYGIALNIGFYLFHQTPRPSIAWPFLPLRHCNACYIQNV